MTPNQKPQLSFLCPWNMPCGFEKLSSASSTGQFLCRRRLPSSGVPCSTFLAEMLALYYLSCILWDKSNLMLIDKKINKKSTTALILSRKDGYSQSLPLCIRSFDNTERLWGLKTDFTVKKCLGLNFCDRELPMRLTALKPFNVEKRDKSEGKRLHGMC